MRKKKVYRFTDELMAKDTIFSFAFGITGLVIIFVSVILSVVMKGNLPEYIGSLLFASLIMGITAFVFGFLGYKNQDGGILGKRASMIIAVVDILLIVVLYLL